MLIHGDCIKELKKLEENSIDLIYLDPPFYTQKTQKLSSKDNKEYSFKDNWSDIIEYKDYIKDRLEGCKRVLKKTGSIFLHCDRNASHYLRVALDEVFGCNNFQSEIVWSYKRWSNSKKGLLNSHQIIFFYSKSKDYNFNPQYTDYSPTTNVDQIFQKRVRNKNGKTVYKKCSEGKVDLIEEKKGVPLSDVWDIPYLNPKAKERVGYPTQKPILLLERIIELCSNEGDIVLDPFCGSGTTLVASKLLNRKYIGIDASIDAINLAKERLDNPIKTKSHLLEKGKEAYINQNQNITNILNKIGAIIVHRNKGIDGFLKSDSGSFSPIPIKVQDENSNIEETINLITKASETNNYDKQIIIYNKNKVMLRFSGETKETTINNLVKKREKVFN